MRLETLTYETGDRVARITLNRPERGNGITPRMPVELAECVERANLDPEVHAIALAGNGSGFCGGYDLVASAEGDMSELGEGGAAPPGSPLDPAVIGTNHVPDDELGPGHRLPVHEPQRARLHEPLPLREAGPLQGPRLLRRRRHRHGALLGPAGDRRGRQDRLPAGPRLGLADDGDVGEPARADAGQAPAPDRRLADRRRGGGVGAGDRGGARPPSSTSASSACWSGSRGCRSTSW